MRWLYTLLLWAVAPFFWWQLARRARREGGEWQVLHPHRFGRNWQCRLPAGSVWVHAVSLGELRAAQPLVHRLLAEGETVLLTHTTATAMNAGQQEFAQALAQGRLQQAWLPYDFPSAVRRFLAAARPRLGVLLEREIWPNLLAACRKRSLPIVLVNARLSARSARALGRWQSLWRPALAGLAAVLAQTRADGERLQALGAPPPIVTGNLKFDVTLDTDAWERGRQWRAAWNRPVIMLASSRDGEEAMWLQALEESEQGTAAALMRGQPAKPLWLLVPRHAQRFDNLAHWLATQFPATDGTALWPRRSSFAGDDTPNVTGALGMLGDSVGEMATYYGAADVALLGGSFADFGGQNLLEACAAGVPVIMGPSVRNFAQAAADAVAAGAAVQVGDMAEAVRLAESWLADEGALAERSMRAQQFVAAHQGATEQTVRELRPWLAARP